MFCNTVVTPRPDTVAGRLIVRSAVLLGSWTGRRVRASEAQVGDFPSRKVVEQRKGTGKPEARECGTSKAGPRQLAREGADGQGQSAVLLFSSSCSISIFF